MKSEKALLLRREFSAQGAREAKQCQGLRWQHSRSEQNAVVIERDDTAIEKRVYVGHKWQPVARVEPLGVHCSTT